MILKGILAFCLAGLLIITVYGGEQEKSTSFPETRNITLLRKIGHELLLSGKDSSSRILPLKKISDSEYQLFFEKQQTISPDSFVNVVNQVISRYGLTGDFTASIHSCSSHEPVYSTLFSSNPVSSIPTCSGRLLPKDCYYLHFAFATPVRKKSPLLLIAGIITMMVAGVYLYKTRKPKKEPEDPVINHVENNHLNIGSTLFFPDQQYLIYKDNKTALTPKETNILSILVASQNLVVDRETLQKEIWEKDGVIVTRSLDMFISKLRKKLQPDSSVRISVVHGKGYKLESSL